MGRVGTIEICPDPAPSSARRLFSVWTFPALLLILCSGWTAYKRPLWYDELFTCYVSRQASAFGVVDALLQGADNHPPLDYLIRHYSLQTIGHAELALRLPSVLAFAVFCVCMFLYVNRRAGRLAGMIAFSIPIATGAYRYSFEARSYAILLALTGIVMVLWQSLGEHDSLRRQRWKGAILGLCLAASVNFHYYSILIFPILIAAEAYRFWFSSRLNKVVLWACAAALIGFIPALPFASKATLYTTRFWTPLDAGGIGSTYAAIFGSSTVVILVFVLLMAAGHRGSATINRPGVAIRSEMFLGACLLAAVPLCYVAAVTVTHAFHFRYVLFAAGGLAVILPLMLRYYAFHPTSEYILAFATLIFACINVASNAKPYTGSGPLSQMQQQLTTVMNAAPADTPVVWGNMLDCFVLAHYFPQTAANRLYCLAGRPESSTLNRAAVGLAPWSNLPITDIDKFLRTHSSFVLAGPPESDLAEQIRCSESSTAGTVPVARCTTRAQ